MFTKTEIIKNITCGDITDWLNGHGTREAEIRRKARTCDRMEQRKFWCEKEGRKENIREREEQQEQVKGAQMGSDKYRKRRGLHFRV